MRLKQLTALALSATVLTGCAIPAVFLVGSGVSAGYMAAQKRGFTQSVMDTKVKTHIKDRLTSLRYNYLTDVGVSVVKSEVLLTGVVKNDSAASEIVRTVQATEGVEKVYSQLMTGDYTSADMADDTWIATQFKTRLLTAQDVYSINYLTDVVKGNIYIMGLANSQSEMERVVHIARTTKGVERVYNYIRIEPGQPTKGERRAPNPNPGGFNG